MTSATSTQADRHLLRWSGALLLGGLILNAAVTVLFHPAGEEDVHEAIFAEYAASDSWEWVHFGQFRRGPADPRRSGRPPSGVASTGADPVRVRRWAHRRHGRRLGRSPGRRRSTSKQAVDAWVAADGPDEAIRFADPETVRWTEWGAQSYFRVLLGAALLMSGAAILAARVLPAWTGRIAVLAGVLSVAVGVDVSYSGLDSGFQQIASWAFQVVVLAFAIGVVVAAVRGRDSESAVG